MSRSSEINRTVKVEVQRIPKYPEESQTDLRLTYAALREKSLGKYGEPGKEPGEVMREAVAAVSERHPDADLKYDKRFFAGADPA